ncbi:MAG: AAA family ATPase [Mycoplasmataceae bacterium]|nr:AAA family ATPase [Mycoplasmataceae bacterium]
MTKVLSFTIQKGGVGKTTSVTNIGSILAKKGKKVLILSFEPQGNIGASFKKYINTPSSWTNVYDLIKNKKEFNPKEVNIFKCGEFGELDVVVSDNRLNQFATELSSTQDIKTKYHSLRLLIKDIKSKKEYDFILIDIDPQANELMINAIIASDEVIIPIKAGIYDSQGLPSIFTAIEGLNDALGLNKKIGLIFPTMINKVSTKAEKTWNKMRDALLQNPLINKVVEYKDGVPQNSDIQNSLIENGVPAALHENLQKKNLGKGVESYKKIVEEYIL